MVCSILQPPATANAQCPDLSAFNDEFNDAATLANWQRHYAVDGWADDQAHTLDIDTTTPGQLHIEPQVCTWFEDYRGIFLFKEVTGDFSAVVRVQCTGLSTAVPTRSFSLAGIMARTPRVVSPGTWTEGQENWVFINTGAGNPNVSQIETKDTVDSSSLLILTPSQTGWIELRMDRIGPVFSLYRRFPGENWFLERVITRNDMPAALQVGIDAYTDWDNVIGHAGSYFDFNSTLVASPPGSRDLIARFDYIRFTRPTMGLLDRDTDGDIDGVDFSTFASCFNAAGNPPRTLGCCAEDASAFDTDCDTDVDGVDFATFASCFNAAGNPPRTLGCPPN
jgi:regulation of enolase protein 1 (concanavalin A-like superfamily)